MSLYPCVAKIITCVKPRLVNTTDGKITPLSNVCNCFLRGFSEGIDVPGKPFSTFSCSYTSVESILKYTESLVSNTNGPAGSSLDCDAPLASLATSAYGNSNGYIARSTETDAMVLLPVDDPKVLRAAEALRIAFNSQRRQNCPALRPYDQPGKIKYAKRGMGDEGLGIYKIEVVFSDNDVVLGRVGHLPRSQQLVDPEAQAALNDTRNLDGRFELLSSVPGPCDNGIPEQLAVSATGRHRIHPRCEVEHDAFP